MGRPILLAVAVAALGGAVFFFTRDAAPASEPAPEHTRPERPMQRAEVVDHEKPDRPPAPLQPPNGAANFVLQIQAPGGGAPGACRLELLGAGIPTSGPIENGHYEGTRAVGPMTAHAICDEGFGRASFTVPELAGKLALEPNAVLSVDVQTADGRAAAGAEVSVEIVKSGAPWFDRFADRDERGQLRSLRKLTANDGPVELSFPPASVKVTATASAGGLASVSKDLDLRGEPVQHLKLTLPVGRALSGTVVDEAQQPVAGLEVKAVNPEHPTRGEQRAVTDATGRFFFTAGIPGTVTLTAERVRAAVGPDAASPLVLVQRQKRAVDGHVVTGAHSPEAGVTIDGAHATASDGAFSFEVEPWEDRHTFEFQLGAARKLVTAELAPGLTHLGDVILEP